MNCRADKYVGIIKCIGISIICWLPARRDHASESLRLGENSEIHHSINPVLPIFKYSKFLDISHKIDNTDISIQLGKMAVTL
jgi:hypothetical protein